MRRRESRSSTSRTRPRGTGGYPPRAWALRGARPYNGTRLAIHGSPRSRSTDGTRRRESRAAILRPDSRGTTAKARSAPEPPAPAPPAQILDLLAEEIRQLRVEFERFFNGALPLPPEELRGRIQARLRSLRNTTFRAAADNFRLADLESRFNSWNELFNRRLRDLEEGRRPAPRHPEAAEPAPYDAARGVVVGERPEPAAVEALYAGLAAGPQQGPRFDLASFEAYVARQAAAIRAKTGCAAVQFRVAIEDGRPKLKARPITE